MVEITTPSTDQADTVTDLWVALAHGQQQYGSHLLSTENRPVVRDQILQRIVADNLLIACADGSIVGFVMFRMDQLQYSEDATTGIVENLYVTPEHRREGTGSALLSAAERELTDAGATLVRVEALAKNDAARSFYAEHGYRPHRMTLEKATETDTS